MKNLTLKHLHFNDVVTLRCGMKCILYRYGVFKKYKIKSHDILFVDLINVDSSLYIARLCYYNNDLTCEISKDLDIVKIGERNVRNESEV